ncbi:MAG: ParA family protein [bacterium]|nr:ParA family protein [bacterium]
MGTIIVVMTHKGGVGKTTSTVNLGHAMSRLGYEVLVVDMDLQCNTTKTLYGKEHPRYNLYHLFDDSNKCPDLHLMTYSTDFPKLSILPNSKDTAALEKKLITLEKNKGVLVLKEKFTEWAKDNFDYVFIDCPPNFGTFTINALISCDCAIIPNEVGSRHSLDGINDAIDFVEDISTGLNKNVLFSKILLTKADTRTTVHKATIDVASKVYKDKLFSTIIPFNTDIQKAEMKSSTVFKIRSNCSSALAYTETAKELITAIGEHHGEK